MAISSSSVVFLSLSIYSTLTLVLTPALSVCDWFLSLSIQCLPFRDAEGLKCIGCWGSGTGMIRHGPRLDDRDSRVRSVSMNVNGLDGDGEGSDVWKGG
jgi:hypothetical protein